MSVLMMTMCTQACQKNGMRSSYHCDYSDSGLEGPHKPHDWFSFVYKGWQHCHGTEEHNHG